MSASTSARLPLVGAAFFLSGAAALAYQVAWQRILALLTGVGIYSVALIVAAFLFGLGVGSHIGGVASTRVSVVSALRIFAACELGIAAFGATSVPLYYDLLHERAGWLYASLVVGGVLHFVTLAVPTILMGMSLPFLTRAMVRKAGSAGSTIAFLYGINTVGAATGALVTPWVFIRHHGLRTAVMAAVVANLAAAAVALVLSLLHRAEPPVEPAAAGEASQPPTDEPRRPLPLWVALYAGSGFVAISLEIVWFRLMDIAVKSTAYTFGTLLAIYLMGSGGGSLLGILLLHRLRRPLRAFCLLQCALVTYAALVVTLLVAIPAATPGLAWFYELWAGQRSFNLGGALHVGPLLRLYVALPLVLFGPPTLLMGLSYPVLQRAVQDDPKTAGRKVGLLQAANIAGCVAGSLAVGLVTLDLLGTTGTIRGLAILALTFAAVGATLGQGRRLFAGLALLLCAVAVMVPSQRAFWMRLHGTSDEATMLDEDATGVAALVPDGDRWRVWAGGRAHSMLPFGGVHTTLGAAPAIVHPAPARVAIVGLGSGDTAASAGCRFDVGQRIIVFEIYAPEHRLLSALDSLPSSPPRLGRFLHDARFVLRIADGRNGLEREETRYDMIEADALWPTSPYAGNLYSLEFFTACARRLTVGGIVCTWAPSARVRATFSRVFPHVLGIAKGTILVGSLQPIPIDRAEWRRRLYAPRTVAYLGPDRVQDVWGGLQTVEPLMAEGSERQVNRDLFPRDEFNSPD